MGNSISERAAACRQRVKSAERIIEGIKRPTFEPSVQLEINTEDAIKELCWSQRSLAKSFAGFIKVQNPTPRRSVLKPTFDE